MEITEKLIKGFNNRSLLLSDILEDEDLIKQCVNCTRLIADSLKAGSKVLFCGNGGSAADAQHLAAELSGKFYLDREPLYAEALHVNTSYLTAVANDYSYAEIYSRLVRARGKEGDIIIGLSTSGNSENIIQALEAARKLNMHTIAFSGTSGGKLKRYADYLLRIPSDDTALIQEAHMMIGHLMCEFVEENIFGDDK